MSPPRVLNPTVAERVLEPSALSQAILDEALVVGGPDECAHLDSLTGQLHKVEPQRIEGDSERIAFWTNLYNALILHYLRLKPVRGNMLMHLRLFAKTAYCVGEHPYTLNLIEHGVLRRNRRPPLHLRRPMRESDPRLAAAPERLDPRVHFALNCGAHSCPPIRHYEPQELDAQLELATRSYLTTEVKFDGPKRRVALPRLMRLYRADFGDRKQQLEFAAARLDELKECLHDGVNRIRVEYGRFDWHAAS